MRELKLKVIPEKKETITWSEDFILELNDKHLTVKSNYISETFKNDDILQGKEEQLYEYDIHTLKRKIESVEWKYDNGDDCYCFTIGFESSSISFNTENKKQAIDMTNKILDWLLLDS